MAFSADGSRIVSACEKDVRTWDPATGKELAVSAGIGGVVVAVSPDGKSLAVAVRTGPSTARDSLTLLDAATGQKRFTVEAYPDWDRKTTYRPTINGLAFSPDGKRVASAGSVGGRWIAEGVVSVWDAATGKALRRFEKLTTSASAYDFVLLARRQEDPDTLFFSRRLAMEGDTELGLLVKNTIDAIELPVLDLNSLKPVNVLARMRHRLAHR